MKKLNFLLVSILLLSIFSLQSVTADEKLDLANIIKNDNPSDAINLAKTMDHSDAKYGDTQVDTYYSFEPPKFTLLGIKLESCTITLFDNEIGHITFKYKGTENNIKVNRLLTESLGESTTMISEDPVVRWKGKNEFNYDFFYNGNSKTYHLSITNDVYRKFNKKYRGG